MLDRSSQVWNLVRLAGEAARSSACSLFVLNDKETALEPAVVIGLPKEYVDGIGEVRVGEQCCGRAVAHRKPWIVSDMLTDPLFADGAKGAQDSTIRAGFSVPVFGRAGRVLGSLACHYDRPYHPTSVDIERNQLYAKLIGFALQERVLERSGVVAASAD